MRLRNYRGEGKYAVVKLDAVEGSRTHSKAEIEQALLLLRDAGVLTYGDPHGSQEFFVLFLKDRFSHQALQCYASAAQTFDAEYARDIFDLANRAGVYSKFSKTPD